MDRARKGPFKNNPVDMVLQVVQKAKADVPAAKLILGIFVPRETPQSLPTKVGIAKRYGLAGIALWRLGLITEEMWAALRATVEPRKFYSSSTSTAVP
ncbi:MAG: hypothetical protein ACUVRC_07270 [Desulfotomaculales bacterium]